MWSFLTIILFLFSVVSCSPSTTGKPPSAILIHVNHSSSSSSPSISQDGTFSLSFTVSLSRFMPGGEIVYLCGVLEQLNTYKKEQIFCNRISLHEFHTENININLKSGIYNLALQTSGGGGGQSSVYLVVSENEFIIIDPGRYATLSQKLSPTTANEVEQIIQLHKTVPTSEFIDTTCISEGQIFVEGKQIIEVAKSDTIGTVKSKLFEKTKARPEHQRLFFMTRELKDTETLEESGVCVVDVGSRFSARSFSSSSLILSLRTIVLLPWTTVTEYNPSQTISKLKSSILSSLSLSSPQILTTSLPFTLHHPKTEGLDQEEKTIKELALEKTSLVNLQWTDTTPIVVNYWSGSAVIYVTPSDTFEVVKNKISEKIGIEANQALMKSLPDDSLFLSNYNFTDVSKIGFHPENIKVFVFGVQNSEGERSFKVSDTVAKVRTKIQTESGIPKENIALFSDGVEMNDEKTLLQYFKLVPNYRLTILALKV